MSARDQILTAVKHARPVARALPDVREITRGFAAAADLCDSFVASAEVSGATVVRGTRAAIAALVRGADGADGRRVSAVEAPADAEQPATPHSFADTELFVCEADVGIAENGAVWLPESALRHPSALFLATAVIVVLDERAIVDNMHTFYANTDVSSAAFGVLVAGPSKTADIEQLLVIGAHGPKTLTIAVVR